MRLMRDAAARFAGAVQHATVLPPRSGFPLARVQVPYEEAAVFLPLVGGVIGALSGLALWALTQSPLPAGIAAALVLTAFTSLGGLRQESGILGSVQQAYEVRSRIRHPDGQVDAATATRANAAGVVALVFTLLIRWQALTAISSSPLWFLLAATTSAGILSRGAAIFLAASSPPRGDGAAAAFVGSVPGWLLLLTGLQVSVAASLLGWKGTAPILVGAFLLVLLLRNWFLRRLQGVNGYCLCTCAAAVECFVLVVAAWRQSF